MNAEQLKQLKKGDEIFIRARYKKVDADGDVLFFHSNTNVYDEIIETESFTHPRNVIMPPSSPKYDPCRKFRKGDRVRVVEWSGRNPVLPFMDCKVGDIGTVIKDEETTSFFVRLYLEGKYEKDMPYCHLELVTPVEELEPYFIKENREELWWEVWKRDDEVGGLLVALFSTGEHPNSKAAAEAESARLNAEHRKEQYNG